MAERVFFSCFPGSALHFWRFFWLSCPFWCNKSFPTECALGKAILTSAVQSIHRVVWRRALKERWNFVILKYKGKSVKTHCCQKPRIDGIYSCIPYNLKHFYPLHCRLLCSAGWYLLVSLARKVWRLTWKLFKESAEADIIAWQCVAAFFCSTAIIHLAMPKYSHYRRHDCSPELFSGFFCVTSAHFWKKSVSTVAAQSAALPVAAMGVQICYHIGLRVAGILLHHGVRMLSYRSQRWGTPPPTPGNTPICSERGR